MARAAVLHNGTQVSMVGGAMREVEGNFAQHSYEAELEAMTDTAAAVRPDAQRRGGAAGAVVDERDG